MKKRTKRKFASFGLSLAMIASSLLSVVPAQAAEATPNVTKAQETSDSQTGKIAIKLNGKAGSVVITDQNNKTVKASVDPDGKGSVTKKDGSQVNVDINKDGTIYTYDETVGDKLTVSVEPLSGYHASDFKVTSDSGAKTVSNNKASFSVEKGTTTIAATFDKQDNAKNDSGNTEIKENSNSIESKSSNDSTPLAKDKNGCYKVAENVSVSKQTTKKIDELINSGYKPQEAFDYVVNTEHQTIPKKVRAKLSGSWYGGHYEDMSWNASSSWFYVNTSDGNFPAFCIDPAHKAPSETDVVNWDKWLYNPVKYVVGDDTRKKMCVAALAYGFGGQYASEGVAKHGGDTTTHQIVLTIQILRKYSQYRSSRQDPTIWHATDFENFLKTKLDTISPESYYFEWNPPKSGEWSEQRLGGGYKMFNEGYATAHKASSNTAISGGNAQYTLDGAEYRIYSDQACTKYTGKGFHFDANGNNTWGNQKLTPGTYYAKEYKAPKGFKADSTVYKFNVTSGNTTNNPVKVDIKENPDYGTLSFQKLDAETGKATPQKGTLDGKNTTFKDAQYTFTYSDGAKKTYTWVMKTDENGKIEWDDAHYVSGDKLIKNDDKAVIPLGTVTYKETKAPLGYNLDPDSHTVEIKAGSKVSAKTESKDTIVRGNMNWIKTKIPQSASDGITMQGIYFKIKNNDTGEVQYVRSDTKYIPGTTDTGSNHCYQYDYNPKTKTGTLLKNTDGTPKHVWFGAGDYTPSKGALTVGEYTVTEMPTAPDKSQGIEGNIGDDLAHFGHKVKANGTDTIAITTGKNGSSTIVDYPVKIHTSASTDKNGEHTVIKGKTANVYDTMKYENLTAGRTYKVRSVIVDKTTGQSVGEATSDLVTSEKDINKKTGNVDGTIVLKIPVDTSKWQDNHDYVVTEYLTWEDMEIKNETDLSLTDQTLYPLSVHTTATDSTTKDHVGKVAKNTTINDAVAYWGLTVGKTYTINGTLMDKSTGKPVLVNGKEVTATKKFTADKKDGTVNITFTFDSSALGGKTLVAFEKVIPSNGEVYTHEDINDVDQSVPIPKIGTTAKDGQTKEHVGVVGKKATVVDTVAYNNLVVGKEYTVKGTLINKSTGKAIQENGKDVTATKTFKAEKADGTVDLTYSLDSSTLQGKDTVVFEDLIHNGVTVATHSDLKDEGQTIHYPGVHTTATDKNTKTHTGARDEKETIVDIVKYTNVVPGKSYTITGTLMDKETGKPYTENGKDVTATKTFAADKTEGEVELDYTVDTSALKEAKTFVVFEDLKYGDVTLVSHADLKDEGQSVNIPSGHTEAADSVTNDQVGTVGKKVTTVDHVIYKNLTPGETYTVKGTVMNPETGKALQENGKDITAEKTFTAKESDGTVDITFTYDSSVLKGKSIVVFEDVYSNDIPVIINEDLKDTKEYIYYPEIHTSASVGGQKNDVDAGNVTLIDTVTYKNLIPGKEYDLKGLLMDKETGEAVKGLIGDVKGETKFTPEKADGTVEVSFKFDASKYSGKTVVVFEDLYHNDKPVTDHHDINDQAQSVSFAEGSPKTGVFGNKTTLIILIVCVAAAAVVVCTVVLRKKKTDGKDIKTNDKQTENKK